MTDSGADMYGSQLGRQVHTFGAAVGGGCFGVCWIGGGLRIVNVDATAG
jgi:hypothetical protein